jgi:hypothetical protein
MPPPVGPPKPRRKRPNVAATPKTRVRNNVVRFADYQDPYHVPSEPEPTQEMVVVDMHVPGLVKVTMTDALWPRLLGWLRGQKVRVTAGGAPNDF